MDSLPLRPAAPAQTAKAVKLAMMDFLEVLCSMPHMNPDSWTKPPQGGWSGIDDAALRARGKTDAAIDFLRQLPCVARESGEPLPLTPHTSAVDFSSGEVVPEWAERLIETPEHVVWFGNASSRDGHYLLLDTLEGKTT